MDHVVLIVGLEQSDFEQSGPAIGSDDHREVGRSDRVIDAIALLIAWRMSSSEIPCLRALARISTATTLVVAVVHRNRRAQSPRQHEGGDEHCDDDREDRDTSLDAQPRGCRSSRDTISKITDAVIEDMTAWQNRPPVPRAAAT